MLLRQRNGAAKTLRFLMRLRQRTAKLFGAFAAFFVPQGIPPRPPLHRTALFLKAAAAKAGRRTAGYSDSASIRLFPDQTNRHSGKASGKIPHACAGALQPSASAPAVKRRFLTCLPRCIKGPAEAPEQDSLRHLPAASCDAPHDAIPPRCIHAHARAAALPFCGLISSSPSVPSRARTPRPPAVPT